MSTVAIIKKPIYAEIEYPLGNIVQFAMNLMKK